MPHDGQVVQVRQVAAENPSLGRRVDGVAFTGLGRDVVATIEQETGMDGVSVLDSIVNRLLVQKGADWTSVILSEYLGLYEDSLGTFTLVWDRRKGELVSHGSVFQSATNPTAALVAHIRTADDFKGLGLGTLVTEEVTAAAFRRGAERVVLATDDKRHRVAQGERAAHAMYSRIGFKILAEKQLVDTVDWLMIVDEPIFTECQRRKAENGGRFPLQVAAEPATAQQDLVQRTRKEYSDKSPAARIEPVRPGDLAHLFVLLNLCPERDFRLKLSAWGIHYGPETERQFISAIRPAIVDQDRLHDASHVVRDDRGAIVAVCATRQETPFTRCTLAIDFYCLPQFLEANEATMIELVRRTIARIEQSPDAPRPCRLAFSGIDEAKSAVFKTLGFTETGNVVCYYDANASESFEAQEYVRTIR